MIQKRPWDKGLIIKDRLPDLNNEINAAKSHWARYAKHKRIYTEIVKIEAKKMPKIKQPVDFEYNWYCKDKRCDPSNIAFACKYIEDGLILANILPNDNWQYVRSIQHLFFVDKVDPRVEVYVY